jgi:multidrug transporter EmrE-like cation transporter
MNKLLETGLIILAVSAVAAADVLIKKVFSPRTGFWTDLQNPWMIGVAALYIAQILIFAYVFDRKADLGIVGVIQTALYAVIVVGSGIMFFNEKVTLTQGIGMGLAILGVIFLHL